MVALNKYFAEDFLLCSTIQYYSIFVFYIISFYMIKYYDNPFFAIWVFYSLIPLLDEIFSLDLRNPTKEEEKKLENNLFFKFPLYLTVIMDWIFTFWSLNYCINQDFNLFKFIGYIGVMGTFSGSNINIAHELNHKNNSLDQLLGTLTLSKNLYMYFYIEHNFGHHRNVATPIDPATSKLNQSLFQFFPQTIFGSLKSAWHLEKKRLLEIEKKKSIWTINNRMIFYGLNNVLLPLFIYKIYGVVGFILFICQAIVGIILLETINYIEHYGLQRKEISPGVYEKVNIHHSWNTSHRVSNYLLFKLQRHSDHHENGYKPYQILSSFEQSPQLPHGYTVCLILAWFPKLWFKVMNEYVSKYSKGVEIKKDLIQNMNTEIFNFIKKISIVLFAMNILGFLL